MKGFTNTTHCTPGDAGHTDGKRPGSPDPGSMAPPAAAVAAAAPADAEQQAAQLARTVVKEMAVLEEATPKVRSAPESFPILQAPCFCAIAVFVLAQGFHRSVTAASCCIATVVQVATNLGVFIFSMIASAALTVAALHVGYQAGRLIGRVDVMEGRVGVMEGRLDVMEERVGVIEGRLDVMEERMGNLVEELRDFKTEVTPRS